MPTVWTEEQVSLAALANHFVDSGLKEVTLMNDRIRLYTPNGFYHVVLIDDERKFLRLDTYLPTDKARSRADKLELIQRFNVELFLCSFGLDSDEDMLVDYAISYDSGLIIGQFMQLLKRFGSMIEHIVYSMNEENLICFNQEHEPNAMGDDSANDCQKSDSENSLALDESRPKNVILN